MEILKALETATAADLAELDQKIAETTTSLEAMKSLRSVLDVRINGPKQRKKRQGKTGEGDALPDNEPAVVTIMKYLDHAGPTTSKTLAAELHLSEKSIGDILERHAPCFEVRDRANRWGSFKKVSLSDVGRNTVREENGVTS